MYREISREYILENFESALENGWIRVYYQPVIRAINGELCSMEALSRWVDPNYGLIPPGIFIDILEKNELIHRLDMYMLEQVCKRCKNCDSKHNIPVSVNLSRLDFQLTDVFGHIEYLTNKYKVSKELIHFEITESILMEDTEYFKSIVDKFHDMGFEVWMDDFGSGYSSLNVLKDYDFDTIKIDMKFFSTFSTKSKKIIESVIDMCKRLEISTVAEGIETKEQFDFLKRIGCDKIQGYYFGRPEVFNDMISTLNGKGIETEEIDMHDYWDKIGKIDLIGAVISQTKDAKSQGENFEDRSSHSLAVIEKCDGFLRCITINSAFERELSKLKIKSKSELEKVINEKKNFKVLNHLIEGIRKGGDYGKHDFVYSDRYCTIEYNCVATYGQRTACLVSLVSSERNSLEKESSFISGNIPILFSVFENVCILEPENDTFINVYSVKGAAVPKGNSFKSAIEDFCENEVSPKDKKRFKIFMNPYSIAEKFKESSSGYIESTFRLKSLHEDEKYVWKFILISTYPENNEDKYLYTIRECSTREAAVFEKYYSN